MSLGLLVGRFGTFLSKKAGPAPQAATPEEPFARDLARVRDAMGHHLVPLMLLARADGATAAAERETVLRYCLDRAKKLGLELTSAERTALDAYLRSYRPTLLQLLPAIKRLEHEGKDDVAALVAAAQAVVDADGERRPREAQFLAELNRDLDQL